MDTRTVSLQRNSGQVTGCRLQLRKGGRYLWLFLLFVSSLYSISAQDSTDVFTADLDSVKIDSFFIARNIDVRNSPTPALYFEIYRWYKTPYCYAGNSAKGIDCSHFVNMLYEKIYGIPLNSSSASIYQQCKPLKGGISHAEEGDLLFFKIKKKRISHIGIYLQNGRFAHASTQLGVTISSLDEPYYRKRFYKAAKPKK